MKKMVIVPLITKKWFYFAGGWVPLIVVLCRTLRPTSLLGAWVLECAKCPTAKLSEIIKSPGSH